MIAVRFAHHNHIELNFNGTSGHPPNHRRYYTATKRTNKIKDKIRLDFKFLIHINITTPIKKSMNTLTIIIVMWTFFITNDQVKISEKTNFGYTVENSEAILQNHETILMNAEESESIFIWLKNAPTIRNDNLYSDKEKSAT